MKNFLIWILIAVLSGALAACSAGNESLGVSKTVVSDTEILTVNITEFSNTEIAVEIKNNSKCEIGYGEPFTLEFYEEGEWHVLKPKNEASFIEIMYILEKESTCTWGHSFEHIYGELPEGKYRLVKEFIVFRSEKDPGEKLNVVAQFKIG